jgi:curved DNA-binding protein CbpA
MKNSQPQKAYDAHYFGDVISATQLKKEYRKLAAKHHPDKGGRICDMQNINSEYHHYLSLLEKHATYKKPQEQGRTTDNIHPFKAKASPSSCDFSKIKIGETVYVNGTECEVLEVRHDDFRIVAKGRSRQALINKSSGRGSLNPRLRASFQNNHPDFRQ